jgi:hypothetical protein
MHRVQPRTALLFKRQNDLRTPSAQAPHLLICAGGYERTGEGLKPACGARGRPCTWEAEFTIANRCPLFGGADDRLGRFRRGGAWTFHFGEQDPGEDECGANKRACSEMLTR